MVNDESRVAPYRKIGNSYARSVADAQQEATIFRFIIRGSAYVRGVLGQDGCAVRVFEDASTR